MTTTITNSKQMELTIKLGQLMIAKETKLKQISNVAEARRSKIFLQDEIEDLRYVINCNCTPTAIKEVYRSTLSNNIKTLLRNYV
jgi:hypothetical protein